jgi:hypothetical protein
MRTEFDDTLDDLFNEILAPNSDQDMADSGSAEATDDWSMLPTAATIQGIGDPDPEQIRQVMKARIRDLRSVLHVEVGTWVVPVIRLDELAAFSRSASPGVACIVVEERSRRHGEFREVRQGTPNPTRWKRPREAGDLTLWKRTVSWKKGSDGQLVDDLYAPARAPCLHLTVGAGWASLWVQENGGFWMG